jgi:DNA repair protein RadC
MTTTYKPQARGIKSWNEAERPREKLLSAGPRQLSLAELLGILIGSGHKEATAVELGREILQFVDYDLHALARWKAVDFCRFKGIGPARAVTIAAALELSRRRTTQTFRPESPLNDSEDVYQYFKGILGDLDHEECWIICLSQANKLLTTHRISEGGITGTVVDPRIIFRHVVTNPRCVSFILAHNHPSGNRLPSRADVQLTRKLAKAARYLDLKLQDHLIITQDGYYSFLDEGLLTEGE